MARNKKYSSSCLLSSNREAKSNRDLFWLPVRDLWPIHLTGRPWHGMACFLPQMCRLSSIPRWKLHLFCQRKEDILQKGLHEVCICFLFLISLFSSSASLVLLFLSELLSYNFLPHSYLVVEKEDPLRATKFSSLVFLELVVPVKQTLFLL